MVRVGISKVVATRSKIVSDHFCYVSALWLNLCNNSDQTLFFQCINVCQVPRELLETSAFGLGFQHLPRDLANVNACKNIFDPYIRIRMGITVLEIVIWRGKASVLWAQIACYGSAIRSP